MKIQGYIHKKETCMSWEGAENIEKSFAIIHELVCVLFRFLL